MANLLLEFENDLAKKVVEYVYNNLDWSSGDGDYLHAQFRRDEDIEDDSEHEFGEGQGDIDHQSEQFQKWFAHWVSDEYGDAEWDIRDGLRSGKIKLFRAITAPKDFKLDPDKHPGRFWSWDADAADAHWGDFGGGAIVWLMETEVTEDAIDWVPTLAMNAIPAYKDEKEVRLKEGYPVEVTAFYPHPAKNY